MTGTDDKLVRPDNSGILAIRLPKTELKKIDNVGHAMHSEITNVFNKIVRNFLLN